MGNFCQAYPLSPVFSEKINFFKKYFKKTEGFVKKKRLIYIDFFLRDKKNL